MHPAGNKAEAIAQTRFPAETVTLPVRPLHDRVDCSTTCSADLFCRSAVPPPSSREAADLKIRSALPCFRISPKHVNFRITPNSLIYNCSILNRQENYYGLYHW